MTHQRSAIARGPHRVLTLHSSSGFPGLCEGSLPQRAWMAGAPNVASRSGGRTGPVGQVPSDGPGATVAGWPDSGTRIYGISGSAERRSARPAKRSGRI